jgi:hypothetical protein
MLMPQQDEKSAENRSQVRVNKGNRRMSMLNILQKLASIDGGSQNTPVEKPAVLTEGKKEIELNLPEPDLSDLRALSGVKKQLNESTIAECGMMPMGSPMPPMMPASINMSAGNAGEIVAMMRGIMDLAKTDSASPGMGSMQSDPMLKALGDVDMDGDHDMKDHDLEQPDDGPLTAEPAGMDDSGADEIADLIKKVKTGQPVKISTDMPVKVSSDEPIKGSTTDKLNARSNDKPEDEGYDNSASDPTDVPKFDPNNMAHVMNKVDAADMADTPYGSGTNPLPKEEEKKEEAFSNAFEAKLFNEYKKFISEGPKPEDVPAFIRKAKEPGKAANKEANDKRNERVGAKVFSSPRK